MIVTNSRERTRFIRFAIVGTVGAVVDFAVLNLLVAFFRLLPVVAQAFSFSAAVLSNYFWNRRWTYPDSRSKNVFRQLIEFAIVSVLGLVIRSAIFAYLEPLLRAFFASFGPQLPFSEEFLSRNLALAFVITVIMFWNFFVNRYWTFADID